jgi:hypothetical protein
LQNSSKVSLKGKYRHYKRKGDGLCPHGTETLIFVQMAIYRLEGQMMGKVWMVFAGGPWVIDRFD